MPGSPTIQARSLGPGFLESPPLHPSSTSSHSAIKEAWTPFLPDLTLLTSTCARLARIRGSIIGPLVEEQSRTREKGPDSPPTRRRTSPPVHRTLILHSPASYSWSRPSRQASSCPSRISTGPLSTAPCTRAHQPSRQSANLHLDAHHTSPPGRIVATRKTTSAPFTLLPSLTTLHPSTLFRPPHSFPPPPRCTPSEAGRETLRPTYRFNYSPGALPVLARLNCHPLLLLHLEPSRCDVIARQPLKSWRKVDQP